jgi:hypothetical protein
MTRHLIHIGYAKAGSTFIQRWFRNHPQLAYRDGGIAGFNSVFQIGQEAVVPDPRLLYRVTSSEDLSSPRIKPGRQPADYSRKGRASMEAEEVEAFATLSSLFPNATILVITRGFRSMAMSSYSQYLRTGGQLTLPDLIGTAQQERPWHYDRLIALYRQKYGAERVIVMPFEYLRDDPEGFCRHLEQRLGLEHVPVTRDRVNESLSPVEMAWYPRLAALANRLPFGSALRIGHSAYGSRRLRLPIRILQKIRPLEPVTSAVITDAMLEPLRGQAESLREEPLYAPYFAEYLL